MIGLFVSLEEIIAVKNRGSGSCPCMNKGLTKDCAAVAAQNCRSLLFALTKNYEALLPSLMKRELMC